MKTNEMIRNLTISFALLCSMCCSTILSKPQSVKIKTRIAQAESLAGAGDYRGAIAILEPAVRDSSEDPRRERALFDLGGYYAVKENPDQDFARSLFYFQRLKKEFPKSRYGAEAQVWVGLLEKLYSLEVELKARTVEFAKDRSSLEQEIAGLRTANLEIEPLGRKLRELENLIQTQKTTIETLQNQLKKMKEIDIQSEKKSKGIK